MARYAGRVGTGDGWGDLAQGAKGRGEGQRPEMTQQVEAIENELYRWTHSTIIILSYKESAGT